MAQLAFKGSNTEGDKIIRVLNTLGGKNKLHCTGKFENYLKERNIPIDSLEANSIREGIELAINEARQWMEKQLLKYLILWKKYIG